MEVLIFLRNSFGLRGPRERFIELTGEGLQINPFEANIKELRPTSTLFYRQQHKGFSFTTTIDYKPDSEKDLAGIVCLQNESSNYVFGITKKGEDYMLLLERTESKRNRKPEAVSKIVTSIQIDIKKPIKLQVKANGDEYGFAYATDDDDFRNLGGIVSGDILSTNVSGGFTGAMIGLYATTGNDSRIDD